MRLEKGLVQIYTGEGKGKTTAALGLGVRALGSDLKVILFQFLKGRPSGELKTIEEHLSNFSIERDGVETFSSYGSKRRDHEKSRRLFELARDKVFSGAYDLVILDEINVALSLGVIELKEVLDLIAKKPDHVELILTGRGAPDELIEAADLVTEMRKMKHPFDAGIGARKGIEE